MRIKKFLYKISNIKSTIYCNLDKNHMGYTRYRNNREIAKTK